MRISNYSAKMCKWNACLLHGIFKCLGLLFGKFWRCTNPLSQRDSAKPLAIADDFWDFGTSDIEEFITATVTKTCEANNSFQWLIILSISNYIKYRRIELLSRVFLPRVKMNELVRKEELIWLHFVYLQSSRWAACWGVDSVERVAIILIVKYPRVNRQ